MRVTRADSIRVGVALLALGLAVGCGSPSVDLTALGTPKQEASKVILTTDYFVTYTSTAPANAPQQMKLHVQRVRANTSDATIPVAFFHGKTGGGIAYRMPGYDAALRLAREGFDVFLPDYPGFDKSDGYSPMSNPCNTLASEQTAALIPNPLSANCPPPNPGAMTNFAALAHALDAAFDLIGQLRGDPTEPVNVLAWSTGFNVATYYMATRPSRVGRGVTYGGPPGKFLPPGSTVAMRVTDRADYIGGWNSMLALRDPVKCPNQVDPAFQDMVWSQFMSHAQVGANWGPLRPDGTPDGVVVFPAIGNPSQYDSNTLPSITAPMLVMGGSYDTAAPLSQVQLAYNSIGSLEKALLTVDCATHYAFWEPDVSEQVLDAAIQWFLGSYTG
jgi:pimeloyl-ACP methyl ester carboxylesterase